jgi:hypothetical protein
MLNVTITSTQQHDTFLEFVAIRAFEKLSNLAVLYNELEEKSVSFEKGVCISCADIDIETQVPQSGVWKKSKCPVDTFKKAMQWAINASITFEIDTESGKQSKTVAYFPGILSDGENPDVAWTEEPDFIILSDQYGEISFVLFNELLSFVEQDVDNGALQEIVYKEINNG